ncbi:hypothetical protein GCM10010172_52200 [Paractinoplanes ferrugineus]|uniref:Uncharacterized protein n=1 Tax=Paractinoplanes ferrugineus TaxID=113564 RepID=A0A919J7F3_9ACTN|nr:hypothetical protein [Actinoplanes ferrugineus]GIE11961.1 hypothetical protein Afe05nite_38010 [Actinoplanes ferrugineus]
MTSVRHRALALLLAVAPAAALLTAAPAQAARSAALPTVKSVSTSKTSFVLSSKAGCSKVTFTAVLSAPMPTSGYLLSLVGIDLYAPGKSGDDTYAGTKLNRVGSSATYSGSLNFCGKYTPGAWRAEVYGAAVPNDADDESDIQQTNVVKVGISLKRPSTLSFNASPEPVKKGKKLTAAGTVKVDGKALSKATVQIYFKANGAKAYSLKGSATTNSKGAFTKKFTAAKTGTWKAVYAGNTTKNTAGATDAVKVK